MSSFPEMEIDPVCSLLVNREGTLGKQELSMSCRCIGVKERKGEGWAQLDLTYMYQHLFSLY